MKILTSVKNIKLDSLKYLYITHVYRNIIRERVRIDLKKTLCALTIYRLWLCTM